MQIGPANDTTQVPAGKTATSAPSPGAKSGFPADLLSALSFTPQKTPPGPDPPFPPTPKVGVEEAAEAPNVPTQKLDSLHRNQKTKASPTATPDPVQPPQNLQIGLAAVEKSDVKAQVTKQADARTAQAIEAAKIAPNVAGQLEKPSLLGKDGQTSGKPDQPKVDGAPKVLPKDESAPIVSIKRIAESGQPDQAPAKPVATAKGEAGPQKTEVGTIQTGQSGSKGGFSSFGQGSGQNKGDRSTPNQDFAIGSISTKTAAGASIAKPAELADSQNLDRQALVRQVADRLQALAASRSQEGVIVQLAPKALGSVILTIKSMGSGVEAHIAASDDQVRKALEASRPDLIQAMQNRGYQVTSVTVSNQTASTTDGSHGQQPQFRPQPQSPQATANDSPTPGTNQPVDPIALRPINPSGVDISI